MTYVLQSVFKSPLESCSYSWHPHDQHSFASSWLFPPYFKRPKKDLDERQCPGPLWWLLDCTSPKAEELRETERPIWHLPFGRRDGERRSHIWTDIRRLPRGHAADCHHHTAVFLENFQASSKMISYGTFGGERLSGDLSCYLEN